MIEELAGTVQPRIETLAAHCRLQGLKQRLGNTAGLALQQPTASFEQIPFGGRAGHRMIAHQPLRQLFGRKGYGGQIGGQRIGGSQALPRRHNLVEQRCIPELRCRVPTPLDHELQRRQHPQQARQSLCRRQR
ncbi:hypothetical protein D3C85_1335250 [compost metagenome]